MCFSPRARAPESQRPDDDSLPRRPLITWSLVLAVVLAGVVLYFVYQDRVAPLLG